MRAVLSVMVIMLVAGTADARQNGDDVSLELGFGTGYARALHGDLDFGDAALSGTARARVARNVALEAQVGYWQHTDLKSFPNGRGGMIETRQTRSFPSVTFSVLAVSGRNARVGPYGGAGVGVYYIKSRFVTSSTPTSPEFVRDRWDLAMGAQFFGGVDVRVANRLKVFGECRFAIESFRDPGASGFRALGGVRVPIG